MNINKIRVSLVDNDVIVLRALSVILKRMIPEIEILWCASSGSIALKYFADYHICPEIILVDMSMEDLSGVEVCRVLRRKSDKIKILAMTAFSVTEFASDASDAGVQGIVNKADTAVLRDMIISLHRNNYLAMNYMSIKFKNPFEANQQVLMEGKNIHVDKLTDREIEILNICLKGYTLKEAAKLLHISESTAKTHMRNSISKLGVRNKVQAIAKWGSIYAKKFQ